MEASTLHDGGAVRLDVVQPRAPWAGSGALGRAQRDDGVVDGGAVEVLVAQARSSEPGPWLAGVLEFLAAPGAARSGAAESAARVPGADESAADESAADESAADESAAGVSAASESGTGEPGIGVPVAGEPAIGGSVADVPVAGRSVAGVPVAEGSVAEGCVEDGWGRGGVLGRLDAVELAAMVAGTQRLVAWAQAVQARAAAALVTAQGGILGVDQAATVVKDRLHITAREGATIVNRADRCARFPDVLDALSAGRIDARKADTLLGAGAELTDQERATAIEVLLPEAPTRTWKWLSEQLNALVARLHGSGEELEEAAAGSNVWLETAAPGMALLTALMPAKDAARVFNAVQAGADQLMRQPAQPRRRGQARAAALTSLVTGRMVPHVIEELADGEAVGAVPGELRVPVTDPGVLIPPVRDTDLVPVPDEDDGVLSTGPVPTGPVPTGPVPTGPVPTGPVEAGVVVRGIEVPATINVTVPASVLADPGDGPPGILDLLGPIPAETARDIAAEGIWHRLVTDPVTGILTDYSTTAYQPSDRLRRAIRARDRTCMSGGCGMPAARCDLDHVEPFDHDHQYGAGEPGQTRAGNLHALCRRHHNLKSLAGWTLERDPVTGAETWTSPTGHTQVYRPEPVDPAVRYAQTAGVGADAPWDPPSALTLARPPRKPAILDAPTASPPDDEEPPF